MAINPVQNQSETSTAQRRSAEIKADIEKAVNEKASKEKAARDAGLRPAVKEGNLGKKIDVTA